jgi:hypothetical protein
LVKTKITQNRISIYIMNLWVKRVALGLCLITATIFYACLEDDSALGFRNQSRKFDIAYVEIPVGSSVLLLDSLRTSNHSSDPIRRLLVGSYSDPVFGNVTAEAYTQIVPGNVARVKEDGAVFDSAVLYMHFDLYSYGSQSSTTLEEFTFHELQEKLTHRNGTDYYTQSPVAYSSTPLGEGKQWVDPELFKDEIEDRNTADTIITVRSRLSDFYGSSLFDAWNTSSQSFTDFEKFSQAYRGLAVVGKNNQKVVGFSTGTQSKLVLHYHTADKDSLLYDFYISSILSLPSSGVSSSRIAIDRSTSQLAGLTQPNQEFIPAIADKRYIQSGSPVCMKLDLSKFLEFSDTIENLTINSAELSIEAIDDPGTYDPPGSLFLQILNSENRLKRTVSSSNRVQYDQDSADVQFYRSRITDRLPAIYDRAISTLVSRADVFNIVGDTKDREAQLSYDEDDKRYTGYITLFLQELQQEESNDQFEKTKFKDLVLYPGNPYAAKSLNRVSYNKSNLKLKIYYTVPTVK